MHAYYIYNIYIYIYICVADMIMAELSYVHQAGEWPWLMLVYVISPKKTAGMIMETKKKHGNLLLITLNHYIN